MDTQDAQEKLESLEEQAKTAQEHLEAVGGAGKSIGDGIGSGIGQGMQSLEKMGGAAASAESAAHTLGNSGTDAGKRMKSAFENAADASDSLGRSFSKNFSKAKDAGKNFGDSIKNGITGAVDTAKKKVAGFVSDTASGAKKIGSAFLHPIRTIQDKFSSVMKDAAKDTGHVGREAKKSKDQLNEMGSSGTDAGQKLKNGLNGALKVLGMIAAAAVVVTGVAKFATAALDASKAAENIRYSFDQTFGESAPDVAQWAGNFADAVHRSESEVKSFLTANKQMYEGFGITGKAATDLSKMTSSLAYDIGNKFGVEDSEALTHLQDAIGGNAEALHAYGVRLDDATLKQSALNMGIHGNLGDMDEATLAQIRFNTIMEQTGELQGEASRSLGGVSGGV